MHDHFDVDVRTTIRVAAAVAADLGHRQVGPAHLLVGLLAADTAASRTLMSFGLAPAAAQTRLEALGTDVGDLTVGEAMFDARAQQVLRAAAQRGDLAGEPAGPATLADELLRCGDPLMGQLLDGYTTADAARRALHHTL